MVVHMTMRQSIGFFMAVILLAPLATGADAAQLRCSFAVDKIDFGDIDVLPGNSIPSTGNVRVRCRGNPHQHVTICPNIGTGSGGTTMIPRKLDKWGSSTAKLNFQIFWPSGSNVWGAFPGPPTPPVWHIQLNASGKRTVNYSMPSEILAGQQAALKGVYRSNFDGHTLFKYWAGTHSDCSGATKFKTPKFTVRARVIKSCNVSATNLDFGQVGNLSSPVDATATITVQCTNNLPYKIRIDGGHTGTTNPANRKMTNGTHDITYGIYRDAARTQGWGRWNSNDVNATGTGFPQTFTAYGRVFAQPTPPQDVYTDTLTVMVVY